MRLSWEDEGSSDTISKTLELELPINSAAAQTFECQIWWDPVSFLVEQYALDDQPKLSEVLTTTGWSNYVQGMTCSDYVQQTWPLHGMSVLYALQDAMLSPDDPSSCESHANPINHTIQPHDHHGLADQKSLTLHDQTQ